VTAGIAVLQTSRGTWFDGVRISSLVKAFIAPKESLGDLDAESASTLIAVASDIAVIVDRDGIVRDLAFHSEDLALAMAGYESWLGRPWSEAVTVESRPKLEALLRDAAANAAPRWRQVNHPVPGRSDVPVVYTAVPIGDAGRIVAFGRDLRAVSALQQRLVDAQQSLERDYSKLRHVENRYRLLFETSTEAVLIVDAPSQRLVEANPAARQLFGESAKRVLGQGLSEIFDVESRQAVVGLLAGVRAGGRPEDVRARLAGGEREVYVSASLFRQESESLFLVRLAAAPGEAGAADLPKIRSKLLTVVENAPDGFVVTGPDGRILTANAAFLEMAQLATEEQAQGEALDRWLGRPGVDLNVLIANLRQRGTVRLFATTLRSEYGANSEVEVSAVLVRNGGQPCLGFSIRNVGRRLMAESPAGRALPRSVEQLTELIGRVSLKDLVRETTDVIERLCIEAALELTGDNRASAAEMLGLSRQSLYMKLKRYGLSDAAAEDEK
jgi:transcriptional regulator PpsR